VPLVEQASKAKPVHCWAQDQKHAWGAGFVTEEACACPQGFAKQAIQLKPKHPQRNWNYSYCKTKALLLHWPKSWHSKYKHWTSQSTAADLFFLLPLVIY